MTDLLRLVVNRLNAGKHDLTARITTTQPSRINTSRCERPNAEQLKIVLFN